MPIFGKFCKFQGESLDAVIERRGCLPRCGADAGARFSSARYASPAESRASYRFFRATSSLDRRKVPSGYLIGHLIEPELTLLVYKLVKLLRDITAS